MVEPRMKVQGLQLVKSNMARVARAAPEANKAILGVLGQTVLQRARGRASVDTGTMRSQITTKATAERVNITSGAWYSLFPHYGTARGIQPDRHLTDPLHELEGKLVRDYEKMLWQFVDRVWVDNV